MKTFYLIKEGVLATLLTLTLTFCISFIPLKFEFIKPIRDGFLGFDIYDLYFSNKTHGEKRDSDIVIVEMENQRNLLANQINLLENYSPAIIGIDAIFEQQKLPIDDLPLIHAVHNRTNIVFANAYKYDPDSGQGAFANNFFRTTSVSYPCGYINFIGSNYSVIRNYPPFLKLNDSLYPAFTTLIAQKFSKGKYNTLSDRANQLEAINYTGTLESYTTVPKEQLHYYDSTGQLNRLLRNKIVLLGFFVKDKPLVIEDLHFSPLNNQVIGKSYPDMYGVVIQANILSMILQENYIYVISVHCAYFFAGLIVFLFLLLVLYWHKKVHHPKHGWFHLIQFLLVLIMSPFFLFVFALTHIKIPLWPIIMSLVLSVELLGVYKAIALWLFNNFGYKTVFHEKQLA